MEREKDTQTEKEGEGEREIPEKCMVLLRRSMGGWRLPKADPASRGPESRTFGAQVTAEDCLGEATIGKSQIHSED